MTLDDTFKAVAPLLPPTVLGTLLGLAYAKEMTPRQKVVYVATAAPLAVYGVLATKSILARHWGIVLDDWEIAALSIFYAVIGMDAVGGLVVLGKKFKEDPLGTVLSIITLGRKGAP